MSLNAETRRDLVNYRLDKAEETMKQVQTNLPNGFWSLIANRLYYAAYYTASAFLVAKAVTTKSHEGTIQQFGLHGVKTGLVPAEMGRFYNRLYALRLTGDYEDNFYLTEEEVMPFLEPTRQFITLVSTLARKELERIGGQPDTV